MGPEQWGAIIGLAVYFGMKLVDALLPNGRHFAFIERWTRKNEGEDSQKGSK